VLRLVTGESHYSNSALKTGIASGKRTQGPGPATVSGREYMSMSEEELRLLTYSTKTMTLTAQRSQSGAPFLVQATFTDGRPSQSCTASHDLAGQLEAFTHFVSKRRLTIDQLDEEFPVQHGVLDLRNQMNPEPGGPYLVYTDKAAKSTALVSYGTAVELTMPLAAFSRLEMGCEELGRK